MKPSLSKGAFIALFLIFIFANAAFAQEFNMEAYNHYIEYQKQQNGELDDFSNAVINPVESSFAKLFNIGFIIFTIIFVSALISLAGAVTLKNGQWMKWSSTTMIFTLIAILLLRLIPILFLTISVSGFTILLQNIITLMVSSLFYLSVGMFLISLFLKMLYKMFEHPKYFKWSRALFTGSIIILVLSTFTPSVILNL